MFWRITGKSVDLWGSVAAISTATGRTGRFRASPSTARPTRTPDGEVTRASPATPGLHPRAGARGRRRPGVRPRPRAQRLRHDDPARPRAARRPGAHREGPRRRDGAPGERPVRARLRRQVVPPAAREGGDRRGRRPLRRAGHRDRPVGRDDHVCDRPPARRDRRPDRRHELAAGRRRPPRRGPGGPHDHPDRRRPDAVGRARRAVRRVGPPERPPRPRPARRPRDGRALRLHLAEPARGRDRPDAGRGRPAAHRRGRPHEVGRRRPQLDRPARPGRRPHHRRPPRHRRPGRSWPRASASSSRRDRPSPGSPTRAPVAEIVPPRRDLGPRRRPGRPGWPVVADAPIAPPGTDRRRGRRARAAPTRRRSSTSRTGATTR